MQTDIEATLCKLAHMDAAQLAAKDFLDRLMEETGLDLTPLARGAKLAPSTLTRPYNDVTGDLKHTLSARTISALEERWGVEYKPLTTNRPKKKPLITLVGYVGAGEQVYPIDDGAIGSGLDEIEAPAGADRNSVAVMVRGDSMFPAFWEGDILIYTRDVPFDRDACMHNECVVKVKDGPTYVKRLMPGSRQSLFTLTSYNAPPILDAAIEWAAPVQFRDQRKRVNKKWPLRK